jgi:hypothetical protein
MDTIQGRVLESLRSVQAFFDKYVEKLADIANGVQRKKLDALVIELEGHVGAQSGSVLAAKGATQKHLALREALLRDHMAKIAGIAAAELPMIPELEVFKMPKGEPSIERLRSAAMGMAKAAAPYADVLVTGGLSPNFIDQLVAAADATVVSVGTRKQNRVGGVAATEGLKKTLSKARTRVHALDALVKSALKDDPSMLAAWRTAKRVEKYVSSQTSVTAQPVVPPTTVAVVPAIPAHVPQTGTAGAVPPSATV